MIDWKLIKFFKRSEFDSPDAPGSGDKMDQAFVIKLDMLRMTIGRPLVITSGFRTLSHNLWVKGKANSAHLRGLAADIACTDSTFRFALVKAAFDLGFPRIEVGPRHIHLDIDPSLPQHVLFLV